MRRTAIIGALVAPAVVAAGLIAPVAGGTDSGPIPTSTTFIPLAAGDIDESARIETDAVLAALPEDPFPAAGIQFAVDDHAVVDDHAHDETIGVPVEPAVVLPKTETDEFGLVAVSSEEPLDPASKVIVRVRENGVWGEWLQLPVSDHGPDPDSAEGKAARYGTDPLLVSEADGVQVRVDTPDGEVPEDTSVTLVDTEDSPRDAAVSDIPVSTVNASTISAGMPTIITRAQWGADESKSGSVSYADTIKVAFVHHTASSSNYTENEAAKQMRNLYSWFTSGLNYSDMAYNFLVDRYGRLYEGRKGGMDRPVIGGHTAGFNVDTFAVSAIGDWHKGTTPPEQLAAMTDAISSLIAWKLSIHHRNPNGTATLTSNFGGGTSNYAPGKKANTPVISGHGDIGSTSCPGQYLHEQLPGIRANVTSRMGATWFGPRFTPANWGAAEPMVMKGSVTAPVSWSLSIASRCGGDVGTFTGTQDVAGPLNVTWNMRDANGNPVPPGTYNYTLTGSAGAEALYPVTGSLVVRATAESPPDPCGPPESFTLDGAGFGHGVGMSQWGAYGQAKEGRTAEQIVTHYYPNTTVESVADDKDIRVALLFQVPSAQMRSEKIGQTGGGIEVTVGSNVVTGSPADVFSFSVDGASVKVTRTAGGQTSDLGSAEGVTVRWSGTRSPGSAGAEPTLLNVIGGNQKFDSTGHRYRYGYVEVLPIKTSSGTRLSVVNSVRIHDEYLKGISEVSSSWPMEALKAQAIASRSYALAKWNGGKGRSTCLCHVDDGGGPYYDQTFAAWAKESGTMGNRWVKAVTETQASETTGRTVVQGGKPITAYYGASTGGITNTSGDVWGGSTSWTGNVDDHWSLNADNPDRAWTVTVSQAKMAEAFGVSAVWALSIGQTMGSGAAKTLRATLADGSKVEKPATSLRTALGLKSTYINAINGVGAGSAAPTAKPSKSVSAVKLKASRTTVRAGGRVIFSGVITPRQSKILVQRQVRQKSGWVVVAKTRTNAKGAYSFVASGMKPIGKANRYRTVAIVKKQPVATSPTIKIVVQKKKKRR